MNEIKGTTGADTLAGTAAADDMKGLAGNDTLLGSAGADKLDGGEGVDTASYEASPAAVTTDISSSQPNVAGDAEGDTLLNIERVIGSAFDDTLMSSTDKTELEGGAGNDVYITSKFTHGGIKTIELKDGGTDEVRTSTYHWILAPHVENLTYTAAEKFVGAGNAENNIISGGKNDDNLWGYDGDDKLYGGESNDKLDGGIGTDHLFGGEGDDSLEGGAGPDLLEGGIGYDYATYSTSSAAVTVNLKSGVHTGDAEGDTYIDIERIVGSKKDDTFIGNAQPNSFDGAEGFDTIDYSTSPGPVTVNLSSTEPQKGGDAEGDTLLRMKRAIGTPFNDTLISDDKDSTLEGGAGDDVYITSEQ